MKLCRIMAGIKCVVFLVVLTFQSTFVRGDTEVSCVYMENCTLPCSYEGADVVIHWLQLSAGNLLVHSFFHNQDQPGNSAQRFRGRASTFKDQISRGNASVLLTGVKVEDEGRYRCYTSTINGNKESFINLKIDAPVHKVDVHQVENGITCRSEGIYPKPELTWSTSPPSNQIFNTVTTTVQQTEQQLYNISSSLILSGSDHDPNFSCTVSTRRNRKRATLLKMPFQDVIDSENTIPCSPSNIQLSNLIWRFNHSQLILNGTVTNYTVSEKWKQHVKKLSESGSLTLQDISADQEGTYTCEVSDAEETIKILSSVRIHKGTSGSILRRLIVVTVIIAAAVAFIMYTGKKGLDSSRNKNHNVQDRQRNGYVSDFFGAILETLFVEFISTLLAAEFPTKYGRGRELDSSEHREQRCSENKKDTVKRQLMGNGSSKTTQARRHKPTASVRCVVL